MRLDKAISNNSNYSRKDVSKLIRNKQVSVNDSIVIDPSLQIDINKDIIQINGIQLKIVQYVYIALNKPKGYVCSNNDNDGKSVLNLIEQNYINDLHIIGRLDKDTTGLVLITNDGQFSHQIKSHKYRIEKEYEVILEKEITSQMLEQLQQDIYLDGKKLQPFVISNICSNQLNICLIEGKYHQIKRMFHLINNHVIHLRRIRIGKLQISNLDISEGQYIFIDKNDI